VLQYMIAGLVLGSIYALAASGLVVTYVSSGILNFAFGSIAYFIARFFYYLNTQHEWPILPAALVAVGLAGPVMGVVLYAVLFRFMRLSPPLIKIVSTIGLSVALPPLAVILFGNVTILSVPGLAPRPVSVYEVFGVPITMDQILVYICVLVTLLLGFVILRFTDAGLKVRAIVDSEAMTSLSGVNPSLVSVCVWAASTFFAGLAGVLAAPVIGLDPVNFTVLVAAAFAAVVAAKLRSLPIAILVGLAMGIAGALALRYLPQSSSFTKAAIPSIPFLFILVFLLYNVIRTGRVGEDATVGGPLDRAIRPQLTAEAGGVHGEPTRAMVASSYVGPVLIMGIIALLPLFLTDFWASLVGLAMAYGVAFLSYTLVTGEGGMIWLCQITFAGVGAIATAQLTTEYHWPVLAAIVVAGLIAAVMGTVIGVLTIRLGDLYVALVTLTFGLLMERLVFQQDRYYNFGQGVAVPRPSFAETSNGFTYMMIVVFCLAALVVLNLRRSTAGLALSAVRTSLPASRTLGISVLSMKVLVAGLGAFMAGVAGGFLASYSGSATPDAYLAIAGLVWLAVLVTNGARSNIAAAIAGMAFAFIPAWVGSNLSGNWVEVPTLLFGLGAVLVVLHQEGVVVQNGRQIKHLLFGRSARPAAPLADTLVAAEPAPVAVTEGAGVPVAGER
jgi:branched-chain amino acid transport system permease protein